MAVLREVGRVRVGRVVRAQVVRVVRAQVVRVVRVHVQVRVGQRWSTCCVCGAGDL